MPRAQEIAMDPVYLPRTSLRRMCCFGLFSRLMKSISYVLSVGIRIPTPPASTMIHSKSCRVLYFAQLIPPAIFGKSGSLVSFLSVKRTFSAATSLLFSEFHSSNFLFRVSQRF